MDQDIVVFGIGGHAVAIDASTGTEIWRTKLKGSDTVTITLAAARVLAAAGGELFCLERDSGQILWHNNLKGLGLGLVAFGTAEDAPAGARILAQRRAAAAAAG